MAAVWRKSSRSNATGNCVEVAVSPGIAAVAVRDTEDHEGPVLTFGLQDWRAFAAAVRAGDVPTG